MFKTKAEKKAFRAGRASGFRAAKESQKPEYTRRERLLASMYAQHMGRKFGLSSAEVEENTRDHLKQLKRDEDFRGFLEREYGERIR